MSGPMRTASLLRRVAAFGLDYLVIAAWLVLLVIAGVTLRMVAPDAAAAVFSDPNTGQLAGFLGVTLPVGLYFIVSEASAAGGTWGKRRLGLRVVTADGTRLSLGRSALRTAVKFLPWELAHTVIWRYAAPSEVPQALLGVGLGVVWVLLFANLGAAFVGEGRRALHDRLSGTRVVSASLRR